jgi:hypothetical protein
VYEAPREAEGGVQRRGDAVVVDFSGLSADSGLEGGLEEDMYEYDEDFAVEDTGANLDEELILEGKATASWKALEPCLEYRSRMSSNRIPFIVSLSLKWRGLIRVNGDLLWDKW